MPVSLKCTLICDACEEETDGILILNSPAEWVVKSPMEWMVEQAGSEEDESALEITCSDSCRGNLHPSAKA